MTSERLSGISATFALPSKQGLSPKQALPPGQALSPGDALAAGHALPPEDASDSEGAPFRQNLWCANGLRLTIVGPEGRVVQEVAKPFARIGAHPRAEIRLAGIIEPCRLFLLATDLGVFYVELERSHAAQPYRRGWLNPGDSLKFGPYEISAELLSDDESFQFRPPEHRASDLCKLGTHGETHPVFDAYFNGQKIKESSLRRRLSLAGRLRPCALLVQEGGVSMFHGAFYWRNKQLWYIDLLSTNGTQRENRNVDATEVRLGDRLELGNVELHFTRIASSSRTKSEPPLGKGVVRENQLRFLDAEAISNSPDWSDLILDVASACTHSKPSNEPNNEAETQTLAERMALENERQKLAEARRELELERARIADERAQLERERAQARSRIDFDAVDPATSKAWRVERVGNAAAIADAETAVIAEQTREMELSAPRHDRLASDLQVAVEPMHLAKPNPELALLPRESRTLRARRGIASTPILEVADDSEDVDQLDESMKYVLDRLASREHKSQRKSVLGRWIAAVVLFLLVLTGAIVASLWR